MHKNSAQFLSPSERKGEKRDKNKKKKEPRGDKPGSLRGDITWVLPVDLLIADWFIPHLAHCPVIRTHVSNLAHCPVIWAYVSNLVHGSIIWAYVSRVEVGNLPLQLGKGDDGGGDEDGRQKKDEKGGEADHLCRSWLRNPLGRVPQLFIPGGPWAPPGLHRRKKNG